MANLIKYTTTESNSLTINTLTAKTDEHLLILQFCYANISCGLPLTEKQKPVNLTFEYPLSYLKRIDFDLTLLGFITEGGQQTICCNTQLLLHQIITTKYDGKSKKIFIKSKAMELLLCICHIMNFNSLCSGCKFLNQPLEKDKIQSAKTIILKNLSNPPTISDLSKQIGINECYLKKGFKELFGQTIFEFVQEQRMNKAYLLLIDRQSVSQVAHDMGYSNPGNFSNAFKKHTGIYPSELIHS